MKYSNPIEYNKYLIENNLLPNIIDYVKEINKIKYKIDISFIDEFIELVDKDNCCIHHNMLQKYGIIKLTGGTSELRNLLKQYDLLENEDFELRNISELRPQGGISNKNEYYLHPRAFKICLIRSRNTKLYAKYYLLLEECIKYYNDYQIELNKLYIIKYKSKVNIQKEEIKFKDDKIDELIRLNKETLDEVKQLRKSNRRLEKKGMILEDQLNDANYRLDDVKVDLEDTNSKLERTFRKLNIATEKRVPESANKRNLEDFVLLKSRNKKLPYRYYAIRAQTKYADHKSEKMITTKNYKQLLRINNVANSINIWHRLKEVTKDHIEFCGNEFKLLTIDDNDLIETISNVYNDRKNIPFEDEDEEYSDEE